MGKSAEDAAVTRQNIVTTAAAEFRTRGFDKVGVADLMGQAGLTHGGFYRHFDSKEQLITEACEECFKLINDTWPKSVKDHSRSGLKYLVSRYLSPKYRDNPAESCAFVMLGSDIARSNDATKQVATDSFKSLVNLFVRVLPEGDNEVVISEATNLACSVIGALSVARMIADRKFSNTVMNQMKESILTLYDDKYPEANIASKEELTDESEG
jgi:TetR/AcrR family transcriptional repressor of nem operon